jgi:hypothetical protein
MARIFAARVAQLSRTPQIPALAPTRVRTYRLAQVPSLRYANAAEERTRRERKKLIPHESPLLTDQQLRDASLDQLEDLLRRINLALQGRGLPGVVWQQPPDDVSEQAGPGESTTRPASD